MAHKYTLGIDFGGSSSKATLLEDSGRVVAMVSREYRSYYPKSGWHEQDAQELSEVLFANLRDIVAQSRVDPAQITAVAVDAATHMAVFCDSYGRPLRKFIHWSDCRSTRQADYLREHYGDLLRRHSVNAVSSAWTLPQILWLNEFEPKVLKNTKRIYFLKDYLRSRLTGDFCTDSVEVIGSMLADDFSSAWCPELCAIAGVDVGMLPEIRDPTDLAGYIRPDAAALTGLRTGTPVIVGSTDTVLEVYASGAVDEGTATCKLATAGRICPITSAPILSKQFFNYRHVIPGLWYPGTGTRACAASYRWYRDVFGAAESAEAAAAGTSAYEIMNREAEQAPPGSDNLFYHPFLQGEMSPYFDDDLCASFVGVRTHHGKGHFTRAVLEGVAYSMRDCLEEIRRQEISVREYRLIGGGAKGKLWRQILADVLATPLTCMVDNDSSLGAAMLAGVAVGMFDSFWESVARSVRVADRVVPIEKNVRIYEEGFKTYREIVAALAPVYRGSR